MSDFYNSIDQKELIHEIQNIDNQVIEELSKENIDKKKIYELRFQQLMKGLWINQNPYL